MTGAVTGLASGDRTGDAARVRTSLLLCLLAWTACTDDAGPPPREARFEVEVDDTGRSEPIRFEIPTGTRSITVIVEGADDALYALGELGLSDRVDLVQLPQGTALGATMEESYQQEQVGQMPGALFQSIRLGTFTQVYPYRPGQQVIAGDAQLRVVSNRPGPVTVTVLLPPEDASLSLPLNLYIVSDTLADPNTPAFITELQRLFAQANVNVAINTVERIPGTALERITQFSEPQEAPTSQAAMIPALVRDRTATGLDVFFVEALPSGVAGLSLGTPGPPLRGSYYFGVIVHGGLVPIELARVTAHEVAHFLALQHVQNRGVSGRTYPDPLDDTTPGAGNLMEDGTVLTADQTFAISRSALLSP